MPTQQPPPTRESTHGTNVPNGFLTVVFVAHEGTGEPEDPEPREHVPVRWAGADAQTALSTRDVGANSLSPSGS